MQDQFLAAKTKTPILETRPATEAARAFRLSHEQMLDALPYTGVRTGRISSSEPSISNVPKSGR
jgi:hypothetical protein